MRNFKFWSFLQSKSANPGFVPGPHCGRGFRPQGPLDYSRHIKIPGASMHWLVWCNSSLAPGKINRKFMSDVLTNNYLIINRLHEIGACLANASRMWINKKTKTYKSSAENGQRTTQYKMNSPSLQLWEAIKLIRSMLRNFRSSTIRVNINNGRNCRMNTIKEHTGHRDMNGNRESILNTTQTIMSAPSRNQLRTLCFIGCVSYGLWFYVHRWFHSSLSTYFVTWLLRCF